MLKHVFKIQHSPHDSERRLSAHGRGRFAWVLSVWAMVVWVLLRVEAEAGEGAQGGVAAVVAAAAAAAAAVVAAVGGAAAVVAAAGGAAVAALAAHVACAPATTPAYAADPSQVQLCLCLLWLLVA